MGGQPHHPPRPRLGLGGHWGALWGHLATGTTECNFMQATGRHQMGSCPPQACHPPLWATPSPQMACIPRLPPPWGLAVPPQAWHRAWCQACNEFYLKIPPISIFGNPVCQIWQPPHWHRAHSMPPPPKAWLGHSGASCKLGVASEWRPVFITGKGWLAPKKNLR